MESIGSWFGMFEKVSKTSAAHDPQNPTMVLEPIKIMGICWEQMLDRLFMRTLHSQCHKVWLFQFELARVNLNDRRAGIRSEYSVRGLINYDVALGIRGTWGTKLAVKFCPYRTIQTSLELRALAYNVSATIDDVSTNTIELMRIFILIEIEKGRVPCCGCARGVSKLKKFKNFPLQVDFLQAHAFRLKIRNWVATKISNNGYPFSD
ncbi:hypothetical protein Syun_018748 [Stephania yunnanensis]|uniref:Uncharacterized protein n=1 Tax=Stephania yunnanensis TaxID=152371 RepID=A0AAP0ISV4_9MAGN